MTDFGWSYPPGVRECDIPGNRPEDERYEQVVDRVYGWKLAKVMEYVHDNNLLPEFFDEDAPRRATEEECRDAAVEHLFEKEERE